MSPLATVVMSGTTSQCSEANIRPVRPKPVITSSKISSTPCRSQISRTSGQYSGPGTCTPAAAEIGSPITAATVSGPSLRIARSISRAHSTSLITGRYSSGP